MNFNSLLKGPSNDYHGDGVGYWDQRVTVKALYAYLPSGENQLLLEEGDCIALVGGKAKGWQFGENLRTQTFGWFPIAYTNAVIVEHTGDSKRDKRISSNSHEHNNDRFENHHYDGRGGSGAAAGGHHHGGSGSGGPGAASSAGHSRSSYVGEHHPSRYDGDLDDEDADDSRHNHENSAIGHGDQEHNNNNNDIDNSGRVLYGRDRNQQSSPTRMFGDTYRQQKKVLYIHLL